MPYEVFGVLFRCSEVHEAHSTLESAASCFAVQTQRYAGKIPIHPVSQQHIYEIVAVDRRGNQRNFSTEDRVKANSLQLDPKSLATEVPTIATFSGLARLYCEALKLIPIDTIKLGDILNYENRHRHFWSTDAGIGQALAYAQQAAFTLELSLKAYLEVLGILADSGAGGVQKWQSHTLLDLFKLLEDDDQKQLEEWWNNWDTGGVPFEGSFRDFLASNNRLYEKWRYVTDLSITDLRSANLAIDMKMLLIASDFLLAASDRIFRERLPMNLNISVSASPQSDPSDGERVPASIHELREGRVRSVRIPEGHDPFGIVELVIESEHDRKNTTALFFRRDVTQYYGLENQSVRLIGESREDEPQILRRPTHLDEPERDRTYSSEILTLRGSVHDMRIVHSAFGGAGKLNLVLFDDTFFTQVECFFVTDEERDKIQEVSLGDKVLIRGLVTLLNGKPLILVGPEHIERVAFCD